MGFLPCCLQFCVVFEASGQFCLTGVWQTPVVSVRYRSGLLGGSLWLWGWVWFNPSFRWERSLASTSEFENQNFPAKSDSSLLPFCGWENRVLERQPSQLLVAELRPKLLTLYQAISTMQPLFIMVWKSQTSEPFCLQGNTKIKDSGVRSSQVRMAVWPLLP